MKAVPILGDVYSFHVPSESKKDEMHLVDLAYNKGQSRCSCSDWQIVANPNYTKYGIIIPYMKDGRINSNRTMCKHIESSRFTFCNLVLKNIIQEKE